MKNLVELLALRAEKLDEIKAFVNANPTMDEAQALSYDKLKNEFDALSREIDLHKAQNTVNGEIVPNAIIDISSTATASAEYMEGFNAYLRGHDVSMNAAMTEGVDADGGYIVPETYQDTVMQKLHTLSKTRSISTVTTTTSTKNIPIEGDAPTFTWIDEGADYGETKPTLGRKQLEAWKLGGIIKASTELLQDTNINFDGYLANQIAVGIDKAEAPTFCTGDGSKKPTGYLTGLTAATTTAAVDAVTENEISKLYYTLPEAYRQRATWRFNSKTASAIASITNGQGVKVYKEEMKMGKLEGLPFVIDENMPEMKAGAKFIVLGDFTYYHIGNRGTMLVQRLNELYAGKGLVGFQVTVRVDAKRMLDEAFVMMQNATA